VIKDETNSLVTMVTKVLVISIQNCISVIGVKIVLS